MKRIVKVTLEKVRVTYTIGFNTTSTVNENTRFAYLSDGGKIKVSSILREIGNSDLDSWRNVEKIRRSSSNKNIMNYLNLFVDKLEIL